MPLSKEPLPAEESKQQLPDSLIKEIFGNEERPLDVYEIVDKLGKVKHKLNLDDKYCFDYLFN